LKLDPDFIAALEKFLAVPNLGQIIVLVDIDPKLDLLQLRTAGFFIFCRAWKDRNEIFRSETILQTGDWQWAPLRPGSSPRPCASRKASDNFMTPSCWPPPGSQMTRTSRARMRPFTPKLRLQISLISWTASGMRHFAGISFIA